MSLKKKVNKEAPKQKADLENLSNELKELQNERIKELEEKVKEYELKEEKLREELNKRFLDTIQKKSEEALSLIKDKEEEIEKKYSSKFEEQKKYLYESQFTELVNIISRLESVLDSAPSNEEVKNYLFGFKMFLAQFDSLLSSFNIEQIKPEVGEEFNSEVMESLETDSVEENQKNKIIKVFSKGYKLHNRVIKLAQVKVGI